MNREWPLITVIIAVRPDQERIPALEALRHCRCAPDSVEILLAKGRYPSRQRNLAARQARGKILYFLDDDSQAAPDVLERVAERFASGAAATAGGPSLCAPEVNRWQRIFAQLMGNRLAFGASAARYRQFGSLRETTEKELILCNLAIDSQAFAASGGFDEEMYPNEENALLDEIQRRGGKLWYDPGLVVYRQPRSTVPEYLRMLYRYGFGRGEQVRRHPSLGSIPNFVPAGLVLWLLALPGLWWGLSAFWIFWPVWAYGAVLFGLGLKTSLAQGIVTGAATAGLLAAGHLTYGTGVWSGLLKRASGKQPPSRPAGDIEIVAVDRDGENEL